ncbi:vesicle-associated membrane protein 714 [Caerostris darwini]|uniref:Vesicle-associated membrane protein 7 n=2 Tax=Caerostris TaxID=172845 RepID=A0AAV4SH76_9ARAC|nr:vesicle-associated membrane protein 714 [Caerostris darwini]GIY64928.1 vesicle-associated membrane protein 714 [Caerostris extrusa]
MSSGIIYAAVAKSGTVLVSSQRVDGDYETEVNSFLPNVPVENNTKSCFVSGIYTYHVLIEDLLIYICVAETNFGKNVPFSFLGEIKNRFTSGSLAIRALTASEHEFDRDFSYVLKDQMIKYSTNAPVDGIGKVQKQVAEVMTVMSNNIEKVVDRGERLESLLDKTYDLEASAGHFQSTAKKVRRHMWCKNVKTWIILIVIASIVITLIVLLATKVITF